MIDFTADQANLIGGALSFFFTIALLSYLIGDNPLYRVALHMFIGVSVGYAALVAVYQVLIPRLMRPLLSGNIPTVALAAVPLILFVFLVLKLSPNTASLGNISIAYLVGVGTAVAIGGALTGTLIPQIETTFLSVLPRSGVNIFRAISNIIIVAGTIATLLYFQFWLRGQTSTGAVGRIGVMKIVNNAGRGFMIITLGAIYGGMILSGIAVFSDRIGVLARWVSSLLS